MPRLTTIAHQAFKYSVYALLTLNVFLFFFEELAASRLQFPGGVPLVDLIESYSATIDTAAWVVLLLVFELETYVLDDRHLTPAIARMMKLVRVICYAFILYALYGYIANTASVYDTQLLEGVSNLCQLAGADWSYTVGLDEYELITATNCDGFSSAAALLRFGDLPAVISAADLDTVQALAWVDVINASVWVLVVILLEIDVRLQEADRFEGFALKASTAAKFVLYPILGLAVIYWAIDGDFVDWWDALLWLIAFVFIELNVFEWRRESTQLASPA